MTETTKQTKHMADTETNEEKKTTLPPLPPRAIKRNNVDLTLDTFEIVKGDNKGKQYLGPKVTIENFEEVIKPWLGLPNIVNIVQTWCKRTAWAIWCNNINDSGEFNMVGFLKGMEEITSAGMKLKDIRDKMDEIQAQLSNLLDKGDIWKDKATGEKSPDLLRVEELNAEFRGYKDMEENRSPKKEASDEPAVVTS